MELLTYKEFIDNILRTRGRHGCGNKYSETHHIIPKCVGGDNRADNLIDLYAREHYEAHRLLAIEHPDNDKLIFAWHMMSCTNDARGNQYQISSEEYEEARIAYVNMLRETMQGEKNHFYGKKHTAESLQKMVQASTGKTHTEESKLKMSQSRIGEKNHFYGKKHTDDAKKKMSDSSSGKNNARSKSVYCNELDEVFGSTREAERRTGICYRSIVDCANGKQKHAGKHPITGEPLTWVYLDNERIKMI